MIKAIAISSHEHTGAEIREVVERRLPDHPFAKLSIDEMVQRGWLIRVSSDSYLLSAPVVEH